jgi:ribonuclease HII
MRRTARRASPGGAGPGAEALQTDLFDLPLVPQGRVAGVDEAGRGPLAGAVFAAAVILDPTRPIPGLADSKALTEARRQSLATEIRACAMAWAVASASVEEIDRLNILQATLLAMKRAVESLPVAAEVALVDGNQRPRLACAVQTIVRGDALVPAISAASILAKTARDADLMLMHERFPDYGFAQHKGYGTALHLERLRALGPCIEHRRTFAPVRELLERS